jgi:V-type H+-transporting ATPase subunit a
MNPAPFYMITFPFLFGIMFGDAGHGSILFFIGLVLIFLGDYDFMKTSQMRMVRET